MDWDRIRVFYAVARAGSFTAAGEAMGLSQSAVSRQIKTLEDDLQAALFTRHARGLVLTQEGEALYRSANTIDREITDAERIIRDSRRKPSGKLRISTAVTFGSVWLTRHLQEFMDEYPDIELELILSDQPADLAKGDADVAIRLGAPSNADEIQRLLAPFDVYACASKDYLNRRGVPSTLADLVQHDVIRFSANSNPTLKGLSWLADMQVDKQGPRVPLAINNLYGVLHAVESGLGIAVLPDYLVQGNDQLVRVLESQESPSYNGYFCYPQELKGSKRVVLLRDYLVDLISRKRRAL